MIIDIDECQLDVDNCTEECYNTIGSFICGCSKVGFEVIVNDQPCKGM